MNRLPVTGPLLSDDSGFAPIGTDAPPERKPVQRTKAETEFWENAKNKCFYVDALIEGALKNLSLDSYDFVVRVCEDQLATAEIEWEAEITQALHYPHAISRVLRLKELAGKPFTPPSHKVRLMRLICEQYETMTAELPNA